MIMSLELLTIMNLTHDYVELHMILTARHIDVFGSKHINAIISQSYEHRTKHKYQRDS